MIRNLNEKSVDMSFTRPGLFGGICWGLLSLGDKTKGYIAVALNRSLCFFTIPGSDSVEEELTSSRYWAFNKGRLILQLGDFIGTMFSN